MTVQPRRQGPGNSVFIGQEAFLLEEALSRLKAGIGDGASMNWATYNAEEGIHVDEILNLCNTFPFLSERRVIVIRNAHKLVEKQVDQILSYLENPSESTSMILVLEGEKVDDKTLKKLARNAAVVRFDPMRNVSERTGWIMNRAKVHGKTIERDAAMLLADLTGTNMWFMATEIEKLSLYTASRPIITIGDVRELVMKNYETSIFTFLDALFDRKKEALFRLYEIESLGVPELEIINRIENQVINHYVVLAGLDWKKVKIHAFVAEKAMARKSMWSSSQLLALLDEVRTIEHQIKSSSISHAFIAMSELIGRYVLGTRNEERPGKRLPPR